MKQTAVEWLKTILEGQNDNPFDFDEWSIAFEHAKTMEKEQMILIYKAAFQDGFNGELFEFEKYYNQTFKPE